jgi:hypothetical protein
MGIVSAGQHDRPCKAKGTKMNQKSYEMCWTDAVAFLLFRHFSAE